MWVGYLTPLESSICSGLELAVEGKESTLACFVILAVHWDLQGFLPTGGRLKPNRRAVREHFRTGQLRACFDSINDWWCGLCEWIGRMRTLDCELILSSFFFFGRLA